MDPSSRDQEPRESGESAVHNSENASFILGTGRLVTPRRNLTEGTPKCCTPDAFASPLNFSTVTVEQLGITPESFVKTSAGKSSPYLKKFRRRSAVGTRGSPETNHLIRFITQQRNLKNAEKSPLEKSWSSPFQGSPGPYRNVSSLRERISAFRSAFHPIKENKKMAHCPEFSESEAGKEGLGEYQQCGSSTNSSKRRRLSSQSKSTHPFSTVEGKVMDVQALTAGAPGPRALGTAADGPEKSSDLGFPQSGFVVEESISVPELTEASNGLAVADCQEADAIPLDVLIGGVRAHLHPNITSPTMPVSPLSESFVLRSVLKKPPSNQLPESWQEHHHSLCNHGPHPCFISSSSNCCKEQKAGEDTCKVLAPVTARKRKRVTFGEDLSPEVFDESLPANTPLRKGGTPVRQKDLSTVGPQYPEQSPLPEQLLQPNFNDKEENLENIEPLPASFPILSPNKSSPSEPVSGTETFISSNNPEKISSPKSGRVTRASNRRKQSDVYNLENTETLPCREKKTSKRKSQETKYTNKTVPKKNQVGKGCRRKKRKGKKSIPKSLYGERDIASKKPLLSPIPELPEGNEMTPSGPGIQRTCPGDLSPRGGQEEGRASDAGAARRRNLFPGLDVPDVLDVPPSPRLGAPEEAPEGDAEFAACGPGEELSAKPEPGGEDSGGDPSSRSRKHLPRGPGVHAGPEEEAAAAESRGPGTQGETQESGSPPHGADATRLCHDLAEAIEQTLRPAGAQPRVRRSSRLQRDPDGQGLVWVPAPPACRRRTVGAPGGAGRELPPALPTPGPRRRRRRSCVSAPAPGSTPWAPEPVEGPGPGERARL
ncbi:cell division cycle-associated protein 2 [Thomomys bottae]